MKMSKFACMGALVLLASAVVSCGDKKDSVAASDVESFAYNQVLKSASRSYEMKIDSMTYYLNISASIDWPEKMGHADISQLQDSLVSYTFGDSIYATPDEAIMHFVTTIDNNDYFDDIDGITAVDSIPSDKPSFFIRVVADMTDIAPEYATYFINASHYLGGAHPQSAALPFTYDLLNGKLMTYKDYFVPGNTFAVVEVIKQSLADQMSTTPEQLMKMGIFQDHSAGVGFPYVKDRTLYVHYNAYDIASYAEGSFDIPVNSVLIAPYLTPAAKRLIGYDY